MQEAAPAATEPTAEVAATESTAEVAEVDVAEAAVAKPAAAVTEAEKVEEPATTKPAEEAADDIQKPAAAVTAEPAGTPPAAAAASATGSVLDGVEMMMGTWAWGTDVGGLANPQWGTAENAATDNAAALRECVRAGVCWLDTAEIYNKGRSEEIVGSSLAALEAGLAPVHVATKFIPLPWRLQQSCLRSALVHSLERLKMKCVDLYQIHSPAFSLRSIDVWAEAIAACQKEGLCRAVGVSNYSTEQVTRTHAILAQHGVQLASNQIEYSLLHRLPEQTGLLANCHKLGVRILAYSPLAMGRLSGKYRSQADLDNLEGRKFGKVQWPQLEKLLGVMQRIADEQGGKSLPQIAINWVICKGGIPIVGAKNAKQAAENAAATGWRLTAQQVKDLDDASQVGSTSMWQGSST
eukprot:TRINITY_DN2343_c0_g1_i1.p1 TRINITY_DN2343_c0_g1~~TRINITY_DN2343_c0_g1_i1.p1  ORF type:complete len:409 (-),score=118.29 TRINITY_DN2343_c0_g1_i1:1010-2236(-)